MANTRKPTEDDALAAARRIVELETAIKTAEDDLRSLRTKLQEARNNHKQIFAAVQGIHIDPADFTDSTVELEVGDGKPKKVLRHGSQGARIVEYLRKQTGPVGYEDVARGIGATNTRAVRGSLWYLAKHGLAISMGKNRWTAVKPA